MGIAALITGLLGGLGGVMGVLDVFNVIPASLGLTVDWTFWLSAAAILFLASIAFSVGDKQNLD